MNILSRKYYNNNNRLISSETDCYFIFRLSTSIFQGFSEWPTSGYSVFEKGILLDLGFYSTPLVSENLLNIFTKDL